MNGPVVTEQSAEALGFGEILRGCRVHGLLAVDVHQRICAFSSEAEKLTGLNAADLLGQPLDRLPAELAEAIRQLLSADDEHRFEKSILLSEAPNQTALLAKGTPCRSERGEVTGAILVLQDTTVAEKLESSIQRLDRLASLGTLAASMAHEIKNAFVAVHTFVDDLVERNQQSDLAGLVKRELRRIDTILSQMLKVGGPARAKLSPTGLHRVLDQSLRLIQPQLETKQIRLCRSFASVDDTVEGDDHQLEQVFINLLINAVAAMEPKGQLTVTTETEQTSVSPTADYPESGILVSIRDTGGGISPENLPRLFEPFFTTKPHGTGLGLAITRRIVLEHHGRINVESDVGKGTTFKLVFPLLHSRG